MYTEEVMKQFMHPKNMGEIKNADGIGKAGNFICGDIMWIFIKVEKNKKEEVILKDIKFKTLGCVAAIATSSMITELAKGETLEGALKITKQDVANALGGLPPIKIHCSVLAADALSEAVYDYLSKNDLPISRELVKTHERIGKELETTEKKA